MRQDARADLSSYADRTDDWLVDRCRDADGDAAFAELVRRHQQSVFRLAVSILGQECAAEAEDVAQDVMIRAHRALPSYRGEARFGTWLYRIAFNVALNVKVRTRHRAPHVTDAALDGIASAQPEPHQRLDDQRRSRAVRDCIDELPEVYQSALRLHYWLGESVRDIAEMLDVPENTVKSYLFRARQLLRGMLTERGFDVR